MPAASTGRTLWAFVSLLTAVYAALGPSTDLHIVNAVVDLDGYPRQGVLAEGVFPGPLIVANKVRARPLCCLRIFMTILLWSGR